MARHSETCGTGRYEPSRLSAGETLDLGVRQRGTARAVKLVAAALPAQGASRSLGLTLKWSASVGSEVLSVDRGSAADAAGIVAGDVITSIGAVTMPAPAQIRRAYASRRRRGVAARGGHPRK